jgi:hypothetical protein
MSDEQKSAKDKGLLRLYLLALASEKLEGSPESENLKRMNKQIKVEMAVRLHEK